MQLVPNLSPNLTELWIVNCLQGDIFQHPMRLQYLYGYLYVLVSLTYDVKSAHLENAKHANIKWTMLRRRPVVWPKKQYG